MRTDIWTNRRVRRLLEQLEPARDLLAPTVQLARLLRSSGASSLFSSESPRTLTLAAAEQVQRGLDALMIDVATVVARPASLQQALIDARVLPGTTVHTPQALVLSGVGQLRAGERRRRLTEAAQEFAVIVLCERLAGDTAGPGSVWRVRRRQWWVRQAARHGLYLTAEVRSAGTGVSVLALRTGSAPPRSTGETRVVREPLAIHIDDDLSFGASFSWISAALALALHDRGAVVSIEPSAVSPALDRDRQSLQRLMRPRDSTVRCSVGWTHYWKAFQRELTGDATLALFAVNYQFAAGVGAGDEWTRSIAMGSGGLAPISRFCRDVLLDTGAAANRMHVIPMGVTASPWTGPPPQLPRARGLRVLHITNAGDSERHGTTGALRAFAAFCELGHRGTLVVRDYGAGSRQIRHAIEQERARGRDVRLWPVFYEEHEMMRALAGFDVLLAPFHGEGFGIKLLDAMASGLALIAPRFGGPCDFIDDEVAYVVEHDLVPMAAGYDDTHLTFERAPMWAAPREASIIAGLVSAATDPEGLAARRRAGQQRADAFSWAASAARVEEGLTGILRER